MLLLVLHADSIVIWVCFECGSAFECLHCSFSIFIPFNYVWIAFLKCPRVLQINHLISLFHFSPSVWAGSFLNWQFSTEKDGNLKRKIRNSSPMFTDIVTAKLPVYLYIHSNTNINNLSWLTPFSKLHGLSASSRAYTLKYLAPVLFCSILRAKLKLGWM